MLKRIIALLMLIACLLSLNACNTSEQLESPVAYYYLRNDVEFDGDNCVIHAEMRESAGFENNITPVFFPATVSNAILEIAV